MTIPTHLANRPTWRGLVIPWINVRGQEGDEHRWTIKQDPVIGRDAWHAPGPTEGDPDFTKQCLQRQRAAMVEGRCQVCARLLAASAPHGKDAHHLDRPRYLIASEGMSLQRVDDIGHTLWTEPWICRRCLPYVLRTCPGIRRRAAADNLTVWAVNAYRLVLATAWHDDHGRDVQAVTWAKAIVTAGHPVDAERIAA